MSNILFSQFIPVLILFCTGVILIPVIGYGWKLNKKVKNIATKSNTASQFKEVISLLEDIKELQEVKKSDG